MGFNFDFTEWINGRLGAGEDKNHSEKCDHTWKAYLARSRVCGDGSESTSVAGTRACGLGKSRR